MDKLKICFLIVFLIYKINCEIASQGALINAVDLNGRFNGSVVNNGTRPPPDYGHCYKEVK